MDVVERLVWLALAMIHLIPALAAAMPGGFARMYGIEPGNALLLLLEHRTVLFAAIVVLCAWSALAQPPRAAALAATSFSVLGYLVLYVRHGLPRGPLRVVARVDLLAVPLLAFIAWRLFSN